MNLKYYGLLEPADSIPSLPTIPAPYLIYCHSLVQSVEWNFSYADDESFYKINKFDM